MTTTHFIHHIVLDLTQLQEDRYVTNVVNTILCNIHMIAVFCSALCMNMLAVEQQMATFWVHTYEKKACKIGAFLMVLTVSTFYTFNVSILQL